MNLRSFAIPTMLYYLDKSTPQVPELHPDAHGPVYTTRALAAPRHVYTTEARAAPGLVWTTGSLYYSWMCLHYRSQIHDRMRLLYKCLYVASITVCCFSS